MSGYLVEADPRRILAEYPVGEDFESRIRTLSADALRALQEQRLGRVMSRAWQVPFYARRWREAGLEPGAVQTLEDLHHVPPYSKADLMASVQAFPPFGDFHGMDDSPDGGRRPVVFHTTSGTTGDPQPLLFGAFDREVQNALLARAYRAHGLTDDDVVHSVYGFGMVNGGHYIREAITHFTRALLLTPGTGADMESRQQLRLMQRFGVTVLVGFADYLLRLAEVAGELGLDVRRDLQVRMLSGHIPAERRAALSAAWGDVPVYDWYGVGDTGIIAAELPGSDGLTVFEDAHILEILDPETDAPLDDGEIGNQCVTVLFKDGIYPIVRFNTQDLSALQPPATGAFRRTRGFSGRSDNMVKLRGINVYPTAIGAIIDQHEQANGEYVCVLERDGSREELTVLVEWRGARDAGRSDALAQQIASELGVRMPVQLCGPGETAVLTEVNSRQKPRRLVDRR
ncbi:MAG: AMP-binding protein [Pseudomonadota bacterium]